MKKILFVCTGNTCRSCMAEALFNKVVEEDKELNGRYCAKSAGLMASHGESASHNAQKALKDGWGIDISTHCARKADKKEIDGADLILTMTRGHKDAILSVYPAACSKIFTLKEFIRNEGSLLGIDRHNSLDISDPFGMTLTVYKLCAQEIKDAIDNVAIILKKSNFL